MKVYKYGLYRPQDPAMLREICFRANRYYNRLIEIERSRRVSVRSAQALSPNVAKLEAAVLARASELETVRGQISASKASRKANISKSHDREEAKRIRGEIKTLRAALKEAKAVAKTRPDVIAAFAAAEEIAHAARLEARASCGIHWGTYLVVEAAFDAARKSKTDPRFSRFDGLGTVGAHFVKGVGVDEISTAGQAQIDPPDERGRTRLRIRVGSQDGRPVWHEWAMIMHRPLPPGRVKSMRAVARRKGGKPKWELHVSVAEETEFSPPSPGLVAVDLGWRAKPDGSLRVGYWCDGREDGELVLPERVVAAVKKGESIRSIRDKLLDELKTWLRADMLPTALPESMLERAKTMHAWRSADRFHGVLRAWVRLAVDGGIERDENFRRFDEWHKRDDHLARYEDGLRRKAIATRSDLYWRFASALAKRGGTVVLEDFDLRDVARRDAPEEGASTDKREPNHHRVIAAPSILRDRLTKRMKPLVVSGARTTLDHYETGAETQDDPARKTVLDYAGRDEDQDRNAAMALFARGVAALSSPEALAEHEAPPKPRVARFASRHKKSTRGGEE